VDEPLDPRTTALVLGAGGPLGLAYHAGVLAGLETAWGFDSRLARLLIGTSAGAYAAALLRANMSGRDILDLVLGRPLRPHAAAVSRHVQRPDPTFDSRTGTYRPAELSYLVHAVRRPWTVRPGRMVAAMLPRGRACLMAYAEELRELFGLRWPAASLWIPAVRLRDGALTVFGRTPSPPTDVGTAVASSSAVPMRWKPVVVGGEAYVDGGIASTSHVSLAADDPETRTVVLSSPLSRMPGVRSLLRPELRRARMHGLEIVAFEPARAAAAAMGWNPFDATRADQVALAAFEETRLAGDLARRGTSASSVARGGG
jgi:NTE family protein